MHYLCVNGEEVRIPDYVNVLLHKINFCQFIINLLTEQPDKLSEFEALLEKYQAQFNNWKKNQI
ncbi:MAG: hypothetical protein ABH830_02845 [Patescibacteria group bacterium]